MIKVIGHGSTHRIGRCPHCNCRFGYTEADTSEIQAFIYLRCPECLAFEQEEDFRDE